MLRQTVYRQRKGGAGGTGSRKEDSHDIVPFVLASRLIIAHLYDGQGINQRTT